MFEVATPFATTGPVPEIEELVAIAGPDVKTTVPPLFRTGFVILRVLVSALVEVNKHTETPLASLMEHRS
jgi:hypothetical protein